jgi:hypothetical protein
MPPVAATAPKEITLRVEELPSFNSHLGRALLETGLNPTEVSQILANAVCFSCQSCEILVKSDEMDLVAFAADSAELVHPKLKRMKVGCCAREGCDGVSYSVRMAGGAGVDWECLTAKALEQMAQQMAADAQTAQQQLRKKQLDRAKRIAIGLVAVLCCFALLFYWKKGRLPFIKKAPKYRIDPASSGLPPKPNR